VGNGSLGQYALYVVNANGSGLRRLTSGGHGEYDPAWSPDGGRIVVAQNQTGRIGGNCCRLAVVNVSTGNVTALTSAVGVARPSYSAKGTYVVYDTSQGVWRIPATGGTATLIASGGFDATMNPGETSVAFIFRNGTRNEIRRVGANGGSQQVLYETSGQIENLEWRGDRIYFTEHTGLGYDGRRNVSFRSLRQAGGSFRIERTFSSRVVGAALARSNDEIFFYRTDGLFRYYDIFPNGTLGGPLTAGDGYTRNWSSINSIDLDGDGTDEMFFYRTDGLFRYYDVRSNGSLPKPMSAGNGYTRGWDTIAALDLDGDGQDEIFFYRDDGLFRFYHIRPNGTLPKPLLGGNTYSKGWDSVVAVDVEGDGQDEMLFYRSDGVFRIYDVRNNGVLGPPIEAGTISSNWTSVSSIDLDGDGRDELLFYRSNGQFTYQDVRTDGSLGSVILSGSGYTPGWSTITSVDLGPG
jgi:dipeptidyl aminopeptidase/acylaminoacyl peptidase